jgi:hypothetical protein
MSLLQLRNDQAERHQQALISRAEQRERAKAKYGEAGTFSQDGAKDGEE